MDESSFNAWIKLYRPDENTNNSSISYYLKGGIVFFFLNVLLSEKNKSIDDVLQLLWKRTLESPESGVTKDEVYEAIKQVGGDEVLSTFVDWTETTKELDIETLLSRMGVTLEWDESSAPWLGMDVEFSGDRVLVKAVTLDGPAYKAGINAGDELLGLNGFRILKERFNELTKYLEVDQTYSIQVSRLSRLMELNLNLDRMPRKIKALTITNKDQLLKVLKC